MKLLDGTSERRRHGETLCRDENSHSSTILDLSHTVTTSKQTLPCLCSSFHSTPVLKVRSHICPILQQHPSQPTAPSLHPYPIPTKQTIVPTLRLHMPMDIASLEEQQGPMHQFVKYIDFDLLVSADIDGSVKLMRFFTLAHCVPVEDLVPRW